MKNLLFLEGPIQTGKSTLIRKCLGAHIADCGGFTSQRLIDAFGNTRGFRIVSAAESLTAPAEDFMSNEDPKHSTDSDVPFISNAGIFKWFADDGRVITDQSVFDTIGVSLLRSSARHPLVLLDEIGGSELLCGEFRKTLDAILSSSKPCLGVLKLAENAQRLHSQYLSDDLSIAEYNALLHHTIADGGRGEVLYYARDREDAAEVERRISEFIQSIFD